MKSLKLFLVIALVSGLSGLYASNNSLISTTCTDGGFSTDYSETARVSIRIQNLTPASTKVEIRHEGSVKVIDVTSETINHFSCRVGSKLYKGKELLGEVGVEKKDQVFHIR